MYSRTCILLMLAALALGIWVSTLAPGTDSNDYFWRCFAANPYQINWFHPDLYCIWLPPLILAIWPVKITVPGTTRTFGKCAQLKGAVWLFLALAAFPWFLPWTLSALPALVAEIYGNHFPQVFHHGNSFCTVCDRTLIEEVRPILMTFGQAILYFSGIVLGACNLRNVSHIGRLPIPDKKYRLFISVGFLLLSMIATDIYFRLAWAEECIHQGFH